MTLWDTLSEFPDGMLAMVAGRGHELVQDARLFDFTGLKITRVRSFDQVIFAFLAHYMLPLFVHTDDGNIFSEATLYVLVTFILSQCVLFRLRATSGIICCLSMAQRIQFGETRLSRAMF